MQAGGWSPYHAHNSYLQNGVNAGYVGLAALIAVILIGAYGQRSFIFFGNEGVSRIWPLAIIVFLTVGSYTETYYPVLNSLEWILFVAAIAYPRQRVETSSATVAPRKKSDRL